MPPPSGRIQMRFECGFCVLLDVGDGLGQLFLVGQVALTGDHDALRLGRAGALHGLGAVAHGGGAQRQVFNEAQDAQAVLGGDAVHAAEILVDDGAQLGVPEVGLGGSGDHQAAGNVLRQANDLVGEAGHVLLADVGQ